MWRVEVSVGTYTPHLIEVSYEVASPRPPRGLRESTTYTEEYTLAEALALCVRVRGTRDLVMSDPQKGPLMMLVENDGDNFLTQWVREQFTPQRCVRWLDGANPVPRRGQSSFVQVLYHDFLYEEGRCTLREGRPRIWSIVCVGLGDGSRSQVSLKVNFSLVDGGFRADIAIESSGAGARVAPRRITKEITFSLKENAPKKLNVITRSMRRTLFEISPMG